MFMDRGMDKMMIYACNLTLFSLKKERLSFVTAWIDLEDIRHNEITWTQDKNCMIPL